MAAQAYNDTPIICNGFKDAEFIEMAMLAQKIGRNVIPVVEKYTELGLILKYADKVGVRPQIGMRVKLAARGGGRWQGSGGYRSKFGLTVAEVLRGLDELRSRRHGGLLQAPALPPRQPDSQHPDRQRARSTKPRASTSSSSRPVRVSSTSMSAADWASTTTARRPTSNRASTTPSRSTPTTSSITFRRCATTRA